MVAIPLSFTSFEGTELLPIYNTTLGVDSILPSRMMVSVSILYNGDLQ